MATPAFPAEQPATRSSATAAHRVHPIAAAARPARHGFASDERRDELATADQAHAASLDRSRAGCGRGWRRGGGAGGAELLSLGAQRCGCLGRGLVDFTRVTGGGAQTAVSLGPANSPTSTEARGSATSLPISVRARNSLRCRSLSSPCRVSHCTTTSSRSTPAPPRGRPPSALAPIDDSSGHHRTLAGRARSNRER
jgi:hypothetical protein